MVGIEILIRVDSGKRTEFLQAAGMFCDRPAGRGLVSCAFFEDVTMPGRFLWVEHWRDREALEVHLASDRHRALLGAVKVLGTLEETMLVEFPPIPDVAQ